MRVGLEIATPADDVTVESLDQMVRSGIWRVFEARLQAMLAEHRKSCETSEGTALYRAQGAAAAMTRVLELPQIVREKLLSRKPGA